MRRLGRASCSGFHRAHLPLRDYLSMHEARRGDLFRCSGGDILGPPGLDAIGLQITPLFPETRFVSTTGELQHPRNSIASFRPVRFLTALGLALWIVLCGILAHLPSAHEALHHEAKDSGHQCAITLFAHGQVQFDAPPPLVVVPVAVPIAAGSCVLISISHTTDYALLPGRGPPFSLC